MYSRRTEKRHRTFPVLCVRAFIHTVCVCMCVRACVCVSSSSSSSSSNWNGKGETLSNIQQTQQQYAHQKQINNLRAKRPCNNLIVRRKVLFSKMTLELFSSNLHILIQLSLDLSKSTNNNEMIIITTSYCTVPRCEV